MKSILANAALSTRKAPHSRLLAAALLGLMFASTQTAWAVVATLNPTADGTMYNANQPGFSNIISVYNDGVFNIQRGLAQFNFGSLPSWAGIGTATLTITHDSAIYFTGNAGQPTYVSAVTAPWTPGQVNWNDRATGTPWTSAGGDFSAPYASYTANIPDNSGPVRLNFDVTALANAWKSGAVANNGVEFTSAAGNGLHNWGVTSAPVQSYQPTLFINTYANYPLGEPGTLAANNVPQDITGNQDMIYPFGVPTVSSDAAPVAGSTNSLSYNHQGSYGAVNDAALPTDNFQVDIWAKVAAADVNQSATPGDPNTSTVRILSGAGLTAGGINLVLNNGFWGAELQGLGYLSDPSLPGAAPVAADTWTELTITRLGGVMSFAVNGVQYGSSTTQTPVWGGMHLAVAPGGSTSFVGKLDAFSITYVPEPSSVALLGIGCFGLVRLVRSRRALQNRKHLGKLLVATIVLAGFSTTSYATIVDVARFRLGEPGSLDGSSRPTDSLSTDTFQNTFINPGVVTSPSTVPNGSYAALGFGSAPSGYYTVNGNGVFGTANGLGSDNFGIELFARADAGQGDNVFFTGIGNDLGGNGGLVFEVRNGNWDVAVPGQDYIGAINGAGQPTSAYWTSLAVIRQAGVSTLYINGVAQPRTSTVTPTFNVNAHLAVSPGGGSWFRGGLDELHIFTFAPGDNPVTFLTPVPEPSSAVLLLIGGVGLLARRRVRK